MIPKIIINYDSTGSGLESVRAAHQNRDADAQTLRKLMRRAVVQHARAQIDIWSQCVWTRARSLSARASVLTSPLGSAKG